MDKKEQVEHSEPRGIIQSNKSSFATLYRLVDLVVLSTLYYATFVYLDIGIRSFDSVTLLMSIIIFSVSAETLDLYRSWRTQSSRTLLQMTLFTWTITSVVIIVLAYTFPSVLTIKQDALLLWIAVSYISLMTWRLVLRKLLFILRKQHRNTRSAVILGATPSGYNLMTQLVKNEHLGIKLYGIYDDRDIDRIPSEFQKFVSGSVEDAMSAAKEGTIDYIYVAMPMSAETRIMEILNQCSDTTCSVYIIPNFLVYNLLNARWQTVGSIQTLSVFDTPFQGATNVLKRIEDIILGSLILVLIAIPMLCIAIGIKVSSGHSPVFKQTRYGLDGRKIIIYKFRTMVVQDNDKTIEQATINDARITRFGSFLRRTSLDELPQFINVLQGRMSIVGPRPHAVAHNEQYRKLIEGYMLRHKVKPGITGWAQINGFRGETDTIKKMVKRVEFDLEYIHCWSVGLDIKIIFTTVVKGFINKNAY